MNTRTTTIRIPTEKLAEIDGLCKKTGNCRNSWINAAIDYVFEHSSEYDFGNDEEFEEPKPTITITDIPEKKEEPIPTVKVKRVSYDDGKSWIDVD